MASFAIFVLTLPDYFFYSVFLMHRTDKIKRVLENDLN